MTTRNRLLPRVALALLAAIALSGCVHYHETMTDPHMHHTAKQNARLSELVDAMNSAEGTAKIDATAAVVNELVAQRGRAHGCTHRVHAAPACGCPACPRASGSCPMD